MRIVSHRKLKEFYETPGREDAQVALERWYEVTKAAQWSGYSDMKADFGSVDSAGNQHYVFNIRGNKYRLVIVVKFVMSYVYIRFIGTHEEYNKINAAEI